MAKESAAAILAKAAGPVNPSAIKAAIVRREPDFDERDFGFSSFSRLLEAMEQAGLLRLEQGAKGQWYVLPPAEPRSRGRLAPPRWRSSGPHPQEEPLRAGAPPPSDVPCRACRRVPGRRAILPHSRG